MQQIAPALALSDTEQEQLTERARSLAAEASIEGPQPGRIREAFGRVMAAVTGMSQVTEAAKLLATEGDKLSRVAAGLP